MNNTQYMFGGVERDELGHLRMGQEFSTNTIYRDGYNRITVNMDNTVHADVFVFASPEQLHATAKEFSWVHSPTAGKMRGAEYTLEIAQADYDICYKREL